MPCVPFCYFRSHQRQPELHLMASEPVSDYERLRQENIDRNSQILQTLKLTSSSQLLRPRRQVRPYHKRSPSCSSRHSLRIRGMSPERYSTFSSIQRLSQSLISDVSTTSVRSVNPSFNPRMSMRLRAGKSVHLMTKITSCLKFLPVADKSVIVAGNAVGDLGFWVAENRQAEKGVYVCSGRHENLITGIAVHEHAPNRVYTTSYDRSVRLMDVAREDKNAVVYKSEVDCFYSICHWPDNVSCLCIGEGTGKCRIWDERAGKSMNSWELHGARINTIDFKNASLMATSSLDGMACLWDLRYMNNNRPKCLNVVRHERAVHSAYFSPSGSLLATASEDNNVGILGGDNFEELRMIPHKNTGVKLLSSNKGIWGWNDLYLFLSNVDGGIDIISVSDGRSTVLTNTHLCPTPQHLAANPCKLGSLAAATGSGKMFFFIKDY